MIKFIIYKADILLLQTNFLHLWYRDAEGNIGYQFWYIFFYTNDVSNLIKLALRKCIKEWIRKGFYETTRDTSLDDFNFFFVDEHFDKMRLVSNQPARVYSTTKTCKFDNINSITSMVSNFHHLLIKLIFARTAQPRLFQITYVLCVKTYIPSLIVYAYHNFLKLSQICHHCKMAKKILIWCWIVKRIDFDQWMIKKYSFHSLKNSAFSK